MRTWISARLARLGAAFAAAFFSFPQAAAAYERILDADRDPAVPSFNLSGSFDVLSLGVSTFRFIAAIMALYMLVMMLHGYVLLKNHGGSVDRHKAAHGVIQQGATGFVYAVIVAAAVGPVVHAATGFLSS